MKEIDIQKLGYAIPLTLVITFAIYMFLHRNDTPTFVVNDLEEQANGKIDSLFRDDRDHNIKKAVLNNGYIYFIPPQWERFIAVGDSLSKKKNTLKLELYKKDRSKLILDYRDTYKKEDRDYLINSH